jgi:glycosyltransferase involved in cell wall biosynthesis
MAYRPHVAHVTTAHNALDSRIFYKECRSAVAQGFETIVIGAHSRPEVVDGVRIFPIPRSRIRLWRRMFGPFHALFAALRSRAEIIHFHDPELIPAAIILKLFGRKIVYDIHEYYSEIQGYRFPEGTLRLLVKKVLSTLIEKGPSRIFDAVVFPTYALRDAIYAGPRAEVLVNLLPRGAIEYNNTPCHKKKYDLVFSGTMSSFRAGPTMEMMAYILAERPTASMLFLGLHQESVNWMLANAPSESVRNSLVFHPRVSHSEVAGILALARIGFNYHPMQRRFQVAIPMKVYEYMAIGLPVVTTRFPELERQLVDDKEIVFVDGDDQRDYARAVLDLLADPDRQARLARAGHARLISDLNWENSEAPKLHALYCRLLNRPFGIS